MIIIKKDHLLVYGLFCRNVRKGTNNRQDSVYAAIEKSEEEKRRRRDLCEMKRSNQGLDKEVGGSSCVES